MNARRRTPVVRQGPVRRPWTPAQERTLREAGGSGFGIGAPGQERRVLEPQHRAQTAERARHVESGTGPGCRKRQAGGQSQQSSERNEQAAPPAPPQHPGGGRYRLDNQRRQRGH